MTLRSFTLALALLFGATPAIGVICEIECEPPMAASGCHTPGPSPDDVLVRGAQHACDHDHAAGEPVFLKSASGRDSRDAFVAVPLPMLPHARTSETPIASAATTHGPPGLSGRSTFSRLTVLRI